MATPKKRFETVDEYISAFPQNVQDILEKLREAIREAAPQAEETISYQIPTLKISDIGVTHLTKSPPGDALLTNVCW
ncbi:MAG TPA: hypothetical protein VFA32_17425 [Dehalococcoidia bacterium]|nr:hypothetical protein [Dehalococcoidia bacterium]